MTDIPESIVDDRRRNLSDGERSYVVADADDQPVAGPFGSESYATTVRDRMADRWPTTLRIVSMPSEVLTT